MFLNDAPVGYKGTMANYLAPIIVEHFLITSTDSKSVEQSSIYQNSHGRQKLQQELYNSFFF